MMRSNIAGNMRGEHEDTVNSKCDHNPSESFFDQGLYDFFDMHFCLEEDSNDQPEHQP